MNFQQSFFLMLLVTTPMSNVFCNEPTTTPLKTSDSTFRFAPLPEGITSFGAAIVDDSLYIYGGHKGRAHHYYKEGQVNELWRLNLNARQKWEVVTSGPHLQGLSLVAHGGMLYRIGGFTAKNSEDEEHALFSVTDFVRFDPKIGKWEALPPMPVPRSSLDAVVHGDEIYVAGGWSMHGENKSIWLETAYSINVAESPMTWVELPNPPFRKRAVSLGAIKNKIYVVGGMTPSGPTTDIAVYDTQKKQWEAGAPLVGKGMNGFGSSTFAQNGSLFSSTYQGELQQLTKDGWKVVGHLPSARFFHRMLPLEKNSLLFVGGANMESGKFLDLEVVSVK